MRIGHGEAPHRPQVVAGAPAGRATPAGGSRLHRALDALGEGLRLLAAVRGAGGRIDDFIVAEVNRSASEIGGLERAGP